LHIRILVPRDLTQAHIPANIAGLANVPAVWQWPDPRTIISRIQHTVIEAGEIPVWVMPCIEENLPIPVASSFRTTLPHANPVPPIPIYPTAQNPASIWNVNGEAWPEETVIINKMRVLVAAAAAAAVAGPAAQQ